MRLKKFCGCFTLQTGTRIIGSISLACSMLTALSTSWLADMDGIENTLRSCCSDNESSLFFETMCLYGAFIYTIVIGVMAGLMIQGVRRRKPDFIFPWFATFTTDLLIWFSMFFGYIVVAPKMLPLETFFIILGVFGVCLGLHFYIWLVVFSFYKELIVENYSDGAPPTEGKVYNQPIKVYQV